MLRDTKKLPPGCKIVEGEGYRKIIYPDGYEQVEFYPGHEPRVYRSRSEACETGECEKCPGVYRLPDCTEPIFCNHECHLKRNQDV